MRPDAFGRIQTWECLSLNGPGTVANLRRVVANLRVAGSVVGRCHLPAMSACAAESSGTESVPGACCPLDQVRTGVTVRIRRLAAEPGVSQRLREIGFGEDQLIRLVAKSANLICQVCNSRLALGQAVAAQIFVEPVCAPGRPA